MSRPSCCRLILPAFFFLAGVSLQAQVKVETSVFAAGGRVAANATTYLAGTFGQPIVGTLSIPAVRLSQGFWFTGKSSSSVSSNEPIAGEPMLQLHCVPNPISTSATVRVFLPHPESSSLTLHDLLGREVLSIGNTQPDPGSATFILDVPELPEGHYTVVLTAGTDRMTLPVHIVR